MRVLLFLMFVTAVCVWDGQKPREFRFRQAENNNFARALRFFVHFPAVVERPQRETA